METEAFERLETNPIETVLPVKSTELGKGSA